jgi:DNA-directed RNA polymerase specialized sigma24 family protein
MESLVRLMAELRSPDEGRREIAWEEIRRRFRTIARAQRVPENDASSCAQDASKRLLVRLASPAPLEFATEKQVQAYLQTIVSSAFRTRLRRDRRQRPPGPARGASAVEGVAAAQPAPEAPLKAREDVAQAALRVGSAHVAEAERRLHKDPAAPPRKPETPAERKARNRRERDARKAAEEGA